MNEVRVHVPLGLRITTIMISDPDWFYVERNALYIGGVRIEMRLALFPPRGCISFSREDGDEKGGTLKYCDSTNQRNI